MGKKFAGFLKSEIVSSIFYMALGLCLILIPEQTIHIICKIIFGVVMIGAGIYHIWIYAGEKERATILDLFTGVIVSVLGVFLFFTPQIIVKILPYLLGAFVLVDNIWMLKGSWKLKKLGNSQWKIFLIGSIVFALLGVAIMVYPFAKITDTVLFAGIIMLADGVSDLIFLFLLKRGVKKGFIESENVTKEVTEKEAHQHEKKKSGNWFGKEKKEEILNAAQMQETDEGENEEDLEDEVIINGRWKAAPEESPEKEITDMYENHEKEDSPEITEEQEFPKLETAVSETKKDMLEIKDENPDSAVKEEQEEVLEEWKD